MWTPAKNLVEDDDYGMSIEDSLGSSTADYSPSFAITGGEFQNTVLVTNTYVEGSVVSVTP